MKTLVLANQKGGVGKTATATLLAHYLGQQALRVLAVDLDHQGNFSNTLRLCNRFAISPHTSDQIMTGPTVELPRARMALVSAGQQLLALERQPQLHNNFARGLRSFLRYASDYFDVCIIDTHPNPDIRLICALVSANALLSPIQLNQEAMDGVGALLNHQRVGVRRIRSTLNPGLRLLGLLPTMFEATPLQKANFEQIIMKYYPIMIKLGGTPERFAMLPRRSAVAEAQGDGLLLWEMKKTAARDAWREIEPSIACIARLLLAPTESSLPGVSGSTADQNNVQPQSSQHAAQT